MEPDFRPAAAVEDFASRPYGDVEAVAVEPLDAELVVGTVVDAEVADSDIDLDLDIDCTVAETAQDSLIQMMVLKGPKWPELLAEALVMAEEWPNHVMTQVCLVVAEFEESRVDKWLGSDLTWENSDNEVT